MKIPIIGKAYFSIFTDAEENKYLFLVNAPSIDLRGAIESFFSSIDPNLSFGKWDQYNFFDAKISMKDMYAFADFLKEKIQKTPRIYKKKGSFNFLKRSLGILFKKIFD